MEAKIKAILGEQAFAIAALQSQLEAVTKEREDLKAAAAKASEAKAAE